MKQCENSEFFDVIVIGGGHAGTEAALAAARLGAKTVLLTHNIETIGQMSCNPAIGGIGKGHLVKEIDALGGAMGRAIDRAGIHFRVLNSSKGPAVRATRAQADRNLYKQAIRQIVESQENLYLFQQPVDDLLLDGDKVIGAITQSGVRFLAQTVVLTAGTFLAGKIHVGKNNYRAGRAGDPAAETLAGKLRDLPLRVGRLKTGTPPRIDSRTIDYSKLDIQPSDIANLGNMGASVSTNMGASVSTNMSTNLGSAVTNPGFSFWGMDFALPRQVHCHIAHTNAKTHQIIRDNLGQSAMYGGMIEGIGPRYCPSIEDKVVKFADKLSHQIFIEPEGLDVMEVYPNGISTSLPFAVQQLFVRSMVGLENAHLTRPGYAIEYDYFDPRDLYPTLESKIIENLFFAGQINGTTGYEEAAAQGLIAGINAARKVARQTPWYPRRDEAYIGVLLDDLVVQGVSEPYRMFTSRAEYRLTLREDNADLRLSATAKELGLLTDKQWQMFTGKQQQIIAEQERLRSMFIYPDTDAANNFERVFGQKLTREYRLSDLLRRPNVNYKQLLALVEPVVQVDCDPVVAEQVEIQAKYAGYISRQTDEIAKSDKIERVQIPVNVDYSLVSGLSNEVREKLSKVRPSTLGQAGRISGVTPVAISLLQIYLKKYVRGEKIVN